MLFLLGLLLIAIPFLQSKFCDNQIAAALESYHIHLKRIDIQKEKQTAQRFNEKLMENAPNIQQLYSETLDISDGIMGVIVIPKIHVELPIYHGVGEEVLSKGVGHMPNTALPMGGRGIHTVLTGHTGYPGGELFTNLTELELGDCFQLLVLDETLTYSVDQIKIVLPDEGDDLLPVAEKDFCTLVTCTPYGVNSHRLLVRGRRVGQ